MLVLALGVWPHLSGLFTPDPDPLTAEVEPVRESLAEEDPLLEELDRLDSELEQLAETDPESGDFVRDADYWAGVLLAMEDSI